MTSIYAQTRLEHSDSIRILELHPPSITASTVVLRGRLTNARLDQKPTYAALSYVWGPTEYTHSITLNDSYPLPITETLFDALKELSSDEANAGGLSLWIDQICINQTDDSEKTSQVQMMSRIFSQARLVIGWLGPADADSNEAVDLFRYFSLRDSDPEKAALGHDLCRRLKLEWRTDQDGNHATSLAQERNSAGLACVALLYRPWFKRLWVIQELVLSQRLELRCGSATLGGNEFFSALESPEWTARNRVGSLSKPLTERIASLWEIKRKRDHERVGLPYIQLAHDFQAWDCGNDHDRLIALHGIANTASSIWSIPWFVPDYNISAMDLYYRFAKGYIQWYAGLRDFGPRYKYLNLQDAGLDTLAVWHKGLRAWELDTLQQWYEEFQDLGLWKVPHDHLRALKDANLYLGVLQQAGLPPIEKARLDALRGAGLRTLERAGVDILRTGLDILHYAGLGSFLASHLPHSSRSDWTCPSWVPDWRITNRAKPLFFLGESGKDSSEYHRDNSDYLIEVDGTSKTLTVRANLVGCITNVRQAVFSSTDKKITEDIFALSKSYSDSELGEFVSAIVMEQPLHSAARRGRLVDTFKKWKERVEHDEQYESESLGATDSTRDTVGNFATRVLALCRNRSFFETDSSRSICGVGPAHVKEGDSICVIRGLSTPAVVREYSSTPNPTRRTSSKWVSNVADDQPWVFMGDCHLRHYMDCAEEFPCPLRLTLV